MLYGISPVPGTLRYLSSNEQILQLVLFAFFISLDNAGDSVELLIVLDVKKLELFLVVTNELVEVTL